MNEVPEPILEVFGIKIVVAAAGFCGGVISLAFISDLPRATRWIAVFSGLCCAIFLTPAVLSLWELLDPFEPAIAFVLGIGGMAIVGKIHAIIKNVDVMQLVRSRKTNDKE